MLSEAFTYPIKVPQKTFVPITSPANFPSFHSRENLRRVLVAVNGLRKTDIRMRKSPQSNLQRDILHYKKLRLPNRKTSAHARGSFSPRRFCCCWNEQGTKKNTEDFLSTWCFFSAYLKHYFAFYVFLCMELFDKERRKIIKNYMCTNVWF